MFIRHNTNSNKTLFENIFQIWIYIKLKSRGTDRYNTCNTKEPENEILAPKENEPKIKHTKKGTILHTAYSF